MREYTTQMDAARKGIITPEMKAVAAKEYRAEEEIRELNARTRDTDRVTDVLSYPMLDEIRPFTREDYPFDVDPENGRVPLGSIVICRDVAARQAEEYGHSCDREETYLFVHGLLHLLGYDHMTEEDKSVMREAEERILSAIGQVR